MKSYALPGEDKKPFLAYLIPKEDETATALDNDQPRQVPASRCSYYTGCTLSVNQSSTTFGKVITLPQTLDLHSPETCDMHTAKREVVA